MRRLVTSLVAILLLGLFTTGCTDKYISQTTFRVGGTVSGLQGSGLVLQLNGDSDLTITEDGAFEFAVDLNEPNPYEVTVLTQPSVPQQTCTVTNGSGAIADFDITDVAVTCSTATYTVGGNVSGLEGSGLALQNNLGDDLTITADGAFVFDTALDDGASYDVSIVSQPTAPVQTCAVASGAGTVDQANVSDVVVVCSTDTFALGGMVVGLEGAGLVLQNNNGDDLTVTADGAFLFPTPVVDGMAYAVTVLTDPSSPNQTCAVTNGTGTMAGADVTNVMVICSTTSYTVGGAVTGLDGTGLVLQNNLGDDLVIAADGTFVFPTALPDGSPYAVTVVTNPTEPSQTCMVSSGSGIVDGGDVTNVIITCTTDTFTVGGTVTGLTGTGLVIQNNGTDNLFVAASGNFTFPTPVPDGSAFSVTVLAQPTGPVQTCTVNNGSGTLAGTDVTNVTIICSVVAFPVGGTVSGLLGSGLVLQNNGGDNLIVAANGSFTFDSSLADGSGYSVNVLTQPTGPTQTCTVTNGAGTVAGGPVTNVAVTCTINTYTVGGTVTGLAGSGLVLQNNAGDNLFIPASGNFVFPTPMIDGSAYDVTILTQPSSPNQTCTVSGATGTLAGANVTDVTIDCTTNTYTVGGSVAGLAGSGLVLQNNNGDNLAIGADGAFTFATALDDSSAFTVTVLTQPTGPAQTCAVTNGAGTLTGANVTSVGITCTVNTFAIGGTVTGLQGTGLLLQNNLGDDLAVAADGTFTFATGLTDGSAYNVTVLAHPTGLSQTCVVSSGTGSIAGAAVTDITVTCTTNTYTVGGSVTGLAGTGLVLQNNAGDNLTVATDGSFTFATALDDGIGFSVTVLTQPNGPVQTCTVTNGSGTITGGNIMSVGVTCTTDAFTVGGTVTGLAGAGLVLRNSGGDNLAVAADGSFTFATAVPDLSAYAVTVFAQPSGPNQTCVVTNGSGNLAGANVNDVTVTCTTTQYTVGGAVSGLAGSGLVLQNNAGDNLAIAADGTFTFPGALDDGTAYMVTVLTQPTGPAQTCSVSSGAGNLAGANVTNVTVTCSTSTFTVGGSVSGLTGTGLVLQNNAGDDLAIAADGTFIFPAALADGSGYAVTVLTQPSTPAQTCLVSSGTGTLAGANVTDVTISCALTQFTVGGTVTGLAGSGLVLQNNAGDDLAVAADGTFTFTGTLTDGGAYAVTVLTQPSGPNQTCLVTSGAGTVPAADVTDVTVTCTTTQYTVGGTVTGLAGSGLVLQNNAGDDLPVAADGSFVFSTPLDDGSAYVVTVLTQPTGLSQTCAVTSGSGNLAGANVNGVTVTCTTNTYTVGGTLTGLAGSGLVLQNNAGDDLAVAADGSFVFSTALNDGSAYVVTVLNQPTGLSQTCAVTNGNGTLAGANVTDVTVTCTTNTYTVGGTISGLAGSGLVLQNNAGDDLAVAADGSFVFNTALDDGSAYAVTVLNQPSGPDQTCVVTNDTGTLAGANISSVTINCTTTQYTVGGTVTGLAGSGLVLQNNAGDNLPVAADGSFVFGTALDDGSAYAVTVLTQPSGLNQTCAVTSGSGSLSGANVTNVTVNCTTTQYTVGGTVTGLTGSGLVLQNNAGDNETIAADGTFTFDTPLDDGSGYVVTVLTQPSGPSQTCVVSSGSGTLAGASITSVTINCTTNSYTVGGTVTGLTGSGLVLQNNTGDDLPVAADGSFVFSATLLDGSAYAVTVLTQPTGPSQSCAVSAGSGTLAGANVTSVVVNCATNSYTVGGTVSGLAGSGLVLQNNSGDDIPVAADGSFTFPTPLSDGSSYLVTVLTQPSGPNQVCTVTSGVGTLAGANVTDVTVNCTTTTYTVGGTVSGLIGTGLVLQNNAGDNETIAANGAFTFDTPLADGTAYLVTVLTHPGGPSQTCTVTNGAGSLAGNNVTNVTISCTTNTYTVGGTVAGLAGSGLVLQNNAGDDLPVAADGSFVFSTALNDGSTYLVTVLTQPTGPSQTCTVTSGSGTLAGANITDVTVNCSTNTYTVGGNVSGLSGSGLVLQNNTGDDLAIAADGSFVFSTALLDGNVYAVTVLTQPSSPTQVCTVTNGSGTLAGSNVTDVTINCTTNTYTVGGTVTGLAGSGLVLQNNTGDDLAIAADGSFVFSTALDDGNAYDVTVLTHPSTPNQTCTVTSGSGNLAGANVTDVAVNCTTTQYTVGGTVTGLAGSGLVLQNNTGDDLAIAADGSFVFSTALDDGSAYAVTVLTQPSTPEQNCTVTNGAGTLAGANVTDVTVTCVTSYSVGGSVTGLNGSGLVLQNNAGDDLAIAADGGFTFTTPVPDGAPFVVTVLTQPTNLSQTCTVTNGSGTISAANVTNVTVTCVTNAFTIGGTANNVAGSGLVLQNNGGDNLGVGASGAFTFATPLTDGATYNVTVLQQPTSPGQTCSVINGSGTVSGGNVISVTVQCVTTTYWIQGNLSGLQGAMVAITNNGVDTLLLNGDGSFQFNGKIADGDSYLVTVTAQPTSPAQICTVTNGSGTVMGADVTDVTVTCVTQSFTIGGTVSGLQGTGLVIQNNAGDDFAVAADGSFVFATPILDLNTYNVTVLTQPTGTEQLCTVTNGAGSVDGANVTDVQINCVTYYSIGGDVSGLVGANLVLQNNGGDDLPIAADGTFTFSTSLLNGEDYRVSILSQPSATEVCLLENEEGTLAGADVTDVTVTCHAGLTAYGAVQPLYPSNGPDWLDYVDNDGTDQYDAADITCAGSGPNYDACIHGGEKRVLVLTGLSSCASITAQDSRNVFDWFCDDSSGTATLYSEGLKPGLGLSDLLDFTTPAWAPNSVIIFSSGTPIGTSSTTVWWSNPVAAANDADDDQTETLNAAGIYVVTQNTDAWYQVFADKVGLAVKPGVTITKTGSCASVVYMSASYTWFEGEVDAATCTNGIDDQSSQVYQVYRNVKVSAGAGGWTSGAIALSGSYGALNNVEVSQGNGIGFYLDGDGWIIQHIRALDNGVVGIRVNSLTNSFLSDIEARNNGDAGILLGSGSGDNVYRDLLLANNVTAGLRGSTTSGNYFTRVNSHNNDGYGFRLSSSSHDNRIRDVVTSNNVTGFTISGDRISAINIIGANNTQQGFSFSGNDNLVANVTAVNSAYDAVSAYGSYNIARNIASVNSDRAGYTIVGDYTIHENIASAHNGWYGVWLSSSATGNNITGHLKTGANTLFDCFVDSELSSTALIDDALPAGAPHEGLCLPGPTSTFGTATIGVVAGDTFFGKVTTDDLSNASDTNGFAAYDDIVDWSSFENLYRGWGLDGGTFPATNQQELCQSGDNCRIWDWRLDLADTGDAGGPVMLAVNPIPTGDDTITHTWLDTSTTTFLRNAIEIEGDGFGDEDHLCEANEVCIYTPNIGAYQGHGNLVWMPFTPGALTGIVLYQYEFNGI